MPWCDAEWWHHAGWEFRFSLSATQIAELLSLNKMKETEGLLSRDKIFLCYSYTWQFFCPLPPPCFPPAVLTTPPPTMHILFNFWKGGGAGGVGGDMFIHCLTSSSQIYRLAFIASRLKKICVQIASVSHAIVYPIISAVSLKGEI